jgi:hypothetical protein
MTFQTPDKLINFYQEIDLEGFHVLDIYVGELDKDDALNKHNKWLSNMVFNNRSEEFSKESQVLKRYPFKSKPLSSVSGFVNTSNYKGYIATYLLNEQGNLFLEYYGFGKYDIDQDQIDDLKKDMSIDFVDEYPDGVPDKVVIEMILDDLQEYDNVQNTPELLEGDFWMCIRKNLNSSKIYIPFKNGVIISEKYMW